MKKEIIIKENGKVVKTIKYTVRDEAHLQSQIKHPHKVRKSKKTYSRKNVDKTIDI